MQTVPACQNLYKNSFTYHYLQDDKILQFEDANQFLGMYSFFGLHMWLMYASSVYGFDANQFGS